MRYHRLLDICGQRRPKAILEIGTHDGATAINMLRQCSAECYTGFDLFEDVTAEISADEFNVKKPAVMVDVLAHLQAADTSAKIELIKGITADTLPAFVQRDDPRKYDLAFIDGGHSIETIQNDWDYVKEVMNPDGVVIFDDFYTGIDASKHGCNRIVQHLPFVLLPDADSIIVNEKVVGTVQAAMVEMADVVRLGL